MSRVQRTIAAARRRALVADLIDGVGRAAVWGAGAGLVLVLADRTIGLGIPLGEWWVLLGAPLVMGAGVGAAQAMAKRASPLIAAGLVDDALTLRDRLTTGLTLAGARGQDAAFAALAMQQSELAADAVRPDRAIPLKFGQSWQVWPALALAGAAAGIFLPSWDLLGRNAAAAQFVAREAQRDRVLEQVAAATQAVVPPPAEQTPDAQPVVPPAPSAELERIRDELERGLTSPEEAAARAVQELETIAERSQQEAEAAGLRQRTTADALSGLPTSARPAEVGATTGGDGGSGGADGGSESDPSAGEAAAPESPITRAIREGDLAAAREAARELMKPKQQLDPAARQQLAEDLQKLAEDIEQLDRQEAERQAKEAAAAKQAAQERDAANKQQESPQPATKAESRPSSADQSRAEQSGDRATKPEQDQSNQGAKPGDQSPKSENSTPSTGDARPQSQDQPKQSQQTGNEPKQGDKTGEPKSGESKPGENKPGEKSGEPTGGKESEPKSGENKPGENKSGESKPGESKPSEQSPSGEKTPFGEKPAGSSTPQDGKPQQRDSSEPAKPGAEKGTDGQSGKPQSGDQKSESQQSSKEGAEGQPRDPQPGEQSSQGQPAQDGAKTPMDPKQIQKQLEDAGMPPEDAQRAAEQMAQEARREQARDQSRQDRQQLSGRLREAAKAMKPEAKPNSDGKSEAQPQAGEKSETPPGAEQGEQADSGKDEGSLPQGAQPEAGKPLSGNQEGAKPESGKPESTRPDGAQPEAGKPGEVPPAASKPETGRPDPAKPESDAPGASKPETAPTPRPAPDPVQKPAPSGESAQRDPKAPAPEGTDPKPDAAADNESSKPEGSDPNAPNLPDQLPGNIPEPSREAIDKLAEHLEKMTRDGQNQRVNEDTARRAREQAEKIAKGLNDEQRKRLGQWADALAQQRPDLVEKMAEQARRDGAQAQEPQPDGEALPPQGDPSSPGAFRRSPNPTPTAAADAPGSHEGENRLGAAHTPLTPSRTELVDARPRDATGKVSENDQVVAEWLAPPAEGGAGPASTVSPQDRVLRAARSAQKAVDDRAIPSRYDRLVQRYFRRLPERVAERAAEPAPVPAKDVP